MKVAFRLKNLMRVTQKNLSYFWGEKRAASRYLRFSKNPWLIWISTLELVSKIPIWMCRRISFNKRGFEFVASLKPLASMQLWSPRLRILGYQIKEYLKSSIQISTYTYTHEPNIENCNLRLCIIHWKKYTDPILKNAR